MSVHLPETLEGPGAVPENLPDNPWLAGGVLLVTALVSFMPYLTGRLAAKRAGQKHPDPVPQLPGGPVQPVQLPPQQPALHADASQELIVQLVNELRTRVQKAEEKTEVTQAKHAALEKQHWELRGKQARTQDEVVKLRAENRELRDEILTLRGRLRGGSSGGA